MKLSRATDGFLLCKRAEGKSDRTLEGYLHHLQLLWGYLGDPDLAAITTTNVREFLNWLRYDYQPRRIDGTRAGVTEKTRNNVYMTLRSLWTWAEQELDVPHVVRPIKAPSFQAPDIIPFTREQVGRILAACDVDVLGHRRPTAVRDRAIVLALLDTGMRSGEMCGLNIEDVDLEVGHVRLRVRRGNPGPKGRKERHVRLGLSARQEVWKYLARREDGEVAARPLLLTRTGRRFTTDSMGQLVGRLGDRAKVSDCHPHRFRHTFSITYLRNGGDIFSLQEILGHSSLKMVKRYLHLAQVDIDEAHKRASPVDRWGF